jgi:hypothetical protein
MSGSAAEAAATPQSANSVAAAEPDEISSIDEIVCVEEVNDAEYFIGDLFRRRFHHDPPDYPKHYVAYYRAAAARFIAVGYVHHSMFEDVYLCGGMVIDDRAYRRIPAAHRKIIREAGGIAEKLLRDTFARLAHAPAIWGYVGDKQALEVDLRAGFIRTDHPHVIVRWNQELPEDQKAARLAHIIALGPF